MDSNPLTLWPEDSPALPCRRRASVEGGPILDGCGPTSQGFYALYDPASSLWRTSQTSFTTETSSEKCSVTFTRSGSMRTGRLYPRAPWVLHTHGSDCSSWPTPRETMSRIKVHFTRYRERFGLNLEEVVAQREPSQRDGYLNPTWIEWLMGFPIGWCDLPLDDSATP